ncbi:MAG: flagellar biosynthetic protein FliO [Deltaproteobacteria bacterium]|nr:flagellar biosynthetic protein FliO [Deltaproteobacteria bacterium]
MNGSYLYLFLKSLVMLGVVLALLAGVLYALKFRMNGRKGASSNTAVPFRVITTLFLGQKRNLAVVEVADVYLLIGVTPNTITCLTKLDSLEAVSSIKKMDTSSKRRFFGWL